MKRYGSAIPSAIPRRRVKVPHFLYQRIRGEQLGLKLESTKAPLQILVVDRVERPSGN